MDKEQEFKELIKERFQKLPKVVQDAIVSADVSQRLRELADTHKLHIDQWETLENEVRYTLLGIQPTDKLVENIEKEVGVDHETALALAQDISEIVFEPIRQELERELDHPQAVAEERTDVEQVRDQVLAAEGGSAPVSAAVPAFTQSVPAPAEALAATPAAAAPPVAPATPPNPAPQITIERTNATPGYVPSVPSHERKAIEGDPYREPIL